MFEIKQCEAKLRCAKRIKCLTKTKCENSFYFTLGFIKIYYFRVIETDPDITDSEDGTSSDESELRSEIAKNSESFGYSELGLNLSQGTSTLFLGKPVQGRERGHSLSVERTPNLCHFAIEPRSKSLRLKRPAKDEAN